MGTQKSLRVGARAREGFRAEIFEDPASTVFFKNSARDRFLKARIRQSSGRSQFRQERVDEDVC